MDLENNKLRERNQDPRTVWSGHFYERQKLVVHKSGGWGLGLIKIL